MTTTAKAGDTNETSNGTPVEDFVSNHDFRAAVAERGTAQAKALYAVLQNSKASSRKYRRCTNQHSGD